MPSGVREPRSFHGVCLAAVLIAKCHGLGVRCHPLTPPQEKQMALLEQKMFRGKVFT